MEKSIYFDDSEYISLVFDDLKKGDESSLVGKALKTALDIRKFEIELFWKRGTYYWAFILAAFTTHFALLGFFFDRGSGRIFCLEEFCDLPGIALFSLVINAMFCFIFSFSWVLVNKGSKFWQENWEEHIYQLENNVMGRLYKTYLNSEKDGKFCWFPLSYKPYAYSVTKVTMLTSIVLCIFSFLLTLFYVSFMFVKPIENYAFCISFFMSLAVPILILGLLIFVISVFVCFGKSSNYKDKTDDDKKWCQCR